MFKSSQRDQYKARRETPCSNLVMENKVYLYFIRMQDKQNKYVVKIGYAKDVEKRLRQLQTGNPYPLFIEYQVFVQSEKKARALENICHSLLKRQKKHLSGEWFKNVRDVYTVYNNAVSILHNKGKKSRQQKRIDKTILKSVEEMSTEEEISNNLDILWLYHIKYHGY